MADAALVLKDQKFFKKVFLANVVMGVMVMRVHVRVAAVASPRAMLKLLLLSTDDVHGRLREDRLNYVVERYSYLHRYFKTHAHIDTQERLI